MNAQNRKCCIIVLVPRTTRSGWKVRNRLQLDLTQYYSGFKLCPSPVHCPFSISALFCALAHQNRQLQPSLLPSDNTFVGGVFLKNSSSSISKSATYLQELRATCLSTNASTNIRASDSLALKTFGKIQHGSHIRLAANGNNVFLIPYTMVKIKVIS